MILTNRSTFSCGQQRADDVENRNQNCRENNVDDGRFWITLQKYRKIKQRFRLLKSATTHIFRDYMFDNIRSVGPSYPRSSHISITIFVYNPAFALPAHLIFVIFGKK